MNGEILERLIRDIYGPGGLKDRLGELERMPFMTPGKMNNIEDRIDAIDDRLDDLEAEIGENPQGSSASVAERIAGIKSDADVPADLMSITASGPKIGIMNYMGARMNNIADDSVREITPGNTIGIILIAARDRDYGEVYGLAAYRVASRPFVQGIALSPGVEVGVGVPTGTTGTDGKVGIYAATTGKIYIENRFGSLISLNIVLFGE